MISVAPLRTAKASLCWLLQVTFDHRAVTGGEVAWYLAPKPGTLGEPGNPGRIY